MKKQRYMIVNLVYASQQTGPLYINLWLDNQLKSLLDKTNLPSLKEKYDLEYVLFTDDESLMHISRHPNFMALGALCEITLIKLTWPSGQVDKFQARYALLSEMLKQTFKAVMDPGDKRRLGAWISFTNADQVYAKGALPKLLEKMEAGHDAVLVMPMRAAADSLQNPLQQLPGAPDEMTLFEMCYKNMHHLWTHSMWDNPLFSKMPYSMLWHSNTGAVSHNFGITPVILKPNQKMIENELGGIDSALPTFAENPYFAEDWLDAPVANIEPLSNGHYPPFAIHQASVDGVIEWSKKGIMKGQEKFLTQPCFYPNKKIFNNSGIADRALRIAEEIKEKIEGNAT